MIALERRVLLVALVLLTVIAGAQADTPYPKVEPGYRMTFPGDEGSHPQFRTEWWYVTGWLQDEQGVQRGFQLTFFRSRRAAQDTANPSRFTPRQLLFAHAALSDPSIGHLLHAQRAARAGFGLAQAQEDSATVFIDDWSLLQSGQSYGIKLRSEDFALDLLLTQTQPPLLQGDAGYSRKGADPSLASYYYSLPHLRTQGEISIGGRTLRVTGTAWFDHEWSSTLLDEQAAGWDWVGLNLTDGGALTAFRIRDTQGNSRWSSATQRSTTGAPCPASTAGTGTVRNDQSIWKERRRWRSPRTGISYPVEWRVAIGGCEVVLRPLFDDQESDSRASTGTIYWEGAVQAFDPQGRLLGRGYLELTGYGSRLRL